MKTKNKKLLIGIFFVFFLGFFFSSDSFAASAKIGTCDRSTGKQSGNTNAAITSTCKSSKASSDAYGTVWINDVKDDSKKEAITQNTSTVSWNGSATATATLYLRGAYVANYQQYGMNAHYIKFVDRELGNTAYSKVNSNYVVNFITGLNANTELNRGTGWNKNTHWSTNWSATSITLKIKEFINAATYKESCGDNCATYTYNHLYIYRCPLEVTTQSSVPSGNTCWTGSAATTITINIKINPQYQYGYKLSSAIADGQTDGYTFTTPELIATGSKKEFFTGALKSVLKGAEKNASQSLTTSKAEKVSYGFKASLNGTTHGVRGYPRYRITRYSTNISEKDALPINSGGVSSSLYNFSNSFTPAAGSTNKSCRKLEYASSVTYNTTTRYKRKYAKKKYKQTIAIRRRSRSWDFSNKKWKDWSAWSYDKKNNSGWTTDTSYSTYNKALDAAKEKNKDKYNSKIANAQDKEVTFYNYVSNAASDRVYQNSESTDKANGTTTYAQNGSSGKTLDQSISRCITIDRTNPPQYQYQYAFKTVSDGTTKYSYTENKTGTGTQTEKFTGVLNSSLNPMSNTSGDTIIFNDSSTNGTNVSYRFTASLSGETNNISGYPRYKISAPGTTITETDAGLTNNGKGIFNYSFSRNDFKVTVGAEAKSCRKLEYADNVTYSFDVSYSRKYAKKKYNQQIIFRRRVRNWDSKNKQWGNWSSWTKANPSPSTEWSSSFSTYARALASASTKTHTETVSTTFKSNTWLSFNKYTSNKASDRVYQHPNEDDDKAAGTKSNFKYKSGGTTLNKSITRCILIKRAHSYYTVTYKLGATSTGNATNVEDSDFYTNSKSYNNDTGHIYVDDNNFQMTFGGDIKVLDTKTSNTYTDAKSEDSGKSTITVNYSIDRSDNTGISDVESASWNLLSGNSNTATGSQNLLSVNTSSTRTALALGKTQSYNQKICYDSEIVVEFGTDGRRQLISRKGAQNCSSSATVNLNFHYPYNFDTSSTAKIGKMLYSGAEAKVEFENTIKERKNPLVKNGKYSTNLPSSHVRGGAIFLAPNNVSTDTLNNLVSGSTNQPRTAAADQNNLCAIITSKLGSTIDSCINADGSTKKLTVPTNQLGAKICAVAGINYADSHDLPNGNLTYGDWNDTNRAKANFGANTKSVVANATSSPALSPNWRLSKVSCAVIAEKTAFQVWNAGFQSSGSVDTSVSSYATASSFGSLAPNPRFFGSWVETTFLPNDESTGFASASALGYNNGSPTGHACDISKLSIANFGEGAACENESTDSSSILSSDISVNSSDKIFQIESRYTTDLTSGNDGFFEGGNINNDTFHNLNAGSITADYQQYNGNTTTDAVIQVGPSAKTRVIKVNGDLTIKHNICAGSGDCNNPNSTLTLASRNDATFTDDASLPQIIIIANNINIDPSVTQIDAWLVAKATNDAGAVIGKINTCAAPLDQCRRTILFNGPVIAGSLELNRTNSNSSTSSALTNSSNLDQLGASTAAEIFNLRPDITLRAYNQSQHYSAANTVFTTEIAPRL